MKRLLLLLVLGCGDPVSLTEGGKDKLEGVFVNVWQDVVLADASLEFSGLRDTVFGAFDQTFDVTGKIGNLALRGNGYRVTGSTLGRIDFRPWTFTNQDGRFNGSFNKPDSLVLSGDAGDGFRLRRR